MPINAVNLTGNVYPAGPKGDTGPANTLEIGTVEKGENASASITGEAPNQTLNLILPKGDKGEKGDTGETNSLSIGTVEKGTVPSATIIGQAPNQILNLVLPKGDTGEKGEVGPRGEQGIQGNPGPINSIKIGRVEKGEEASVTIVGESPNQILNFVLPIGPKGNTGEKGDQGPKGEQGIQGETGATTSLSIGRVSSGEEASATIIGEAPDQILNLVLPKGDKGEKGNVGPQGEQGIQGNPGPANSLTIGTVEKGAVPSATITGNSPNQVLNLVLPTGETDEIEAIKKENSLLKSQIPEGHASGNNIHLEDSSNMDFEWKLRGKSYQKVKPYNNLVKNADFKSDLNEWKASSKFSVVNKNGIKYLKISTSTAGFNRAYQGLNTIVGHKYYVAMKCIKDKAWVSAELFLSESVSDNYPQPAKGISSNIYQNETSVSTILVPESSNCSIGVMFQSSNTDEVWEAYFRDFICIDLTELYGEGNEPDQTTCDNLFTFDKVAYGTSPSAYTLSQIENVGDNINLLNKDTVDASNNLRGNALDTGRRLIANKDGNYTYGAFKLGGRELLGKTLGIHADIETTGGNPRISIFAGNSSSLTKSLLQVVLSASGTGYMTIPSNLNSELDTISAVLYVTTDASVVAGTYVDYTNLKVQVGSEKVVYSAYNCGSLGVTISNKNLYKIEKVINDTNYSKIIYKDENGNVSFTTGGIPLIIAPTKIKEKTEYTYILKCKSNVTTENNINFTGIYEDGTSELLSANKKKNTNEFIVKFKTNKEKTLAYVTQQYTNSAGVTIITEGTMILEGDYLNLDEPYEIHQEQEIIFPLAKGQKLRSLPNGVKDYLAEDGIHKNVGIIILNGSGGTNESYFKTLDNKFALGVNTEKGLLLKNLKTDNLKISVLSDKFLGVPWDIMKDTIEGWQIALRQDGSYTYLRLLTTGIEDTKALEIFLQNNNAIVEYPLAEEEIIPYTQEQQAVIDKILYTYKNVTNISVDNELAMLDITYKKDIETMFNNQAKEYNERLSNIENLLNTTETSALLLDNLENDLKEEV